MPRLRGFVKDRSGLAAIEYALVGTLVSMAILGGVTLLGREVTALYAMVVDAFPQTSDGSSGGASGAKSGGGSGGSSGGSSGGGSGSSSTGGSWGGGPGNGNAYGKGNGKGNGNGKP